MSKLYIGFFVIVAVYLFYKIKTKKPKPQRNENQSRDFSDLATEFLFYEMMNQKPMRLPPIHPARQHVSSYTQMQQRGQHQREQQQQQQRHSSYMVYPQDRGEQQTNSIFLKNKMKPKRKQWGVRVRNKIARSQDWRCAICKELLPEMFHLDHIIPLCNHGKDEQFNLQCLCANCHSSKTNDEGIRFGF